MIMAKDVKKKFTVVLDIGTDEAEKQLTKTAEHIKQTLKSLSKGSGTLQYFNELTDIIAQIDNQMANLRATYGDGFDGLFAKISASVQSDFQSILEFARKKLAEFNKDVQADKAHLEELNAMMTDYKKAAKVGEQAFKLEKITGFKGTKKEVQALYAEFDKLVEAKQTFESSGDFTSEAYIKNYIKLMKTAAGLINADRLSENEGKDFGIDIMALSDKAEQAKNIIQEMFGGISANPAYHSNIFMQLDTDIKGAMYSLNAWADALARVMSDSIKAAFSGESFAAAVHDSTNNAITALESGKQKIVAAFKSYYKAVEQAQKDGVDLENFDQSAAMDTIESEIQDMLYQWGAKTSSKLSAFDELTYIKDAIIEAFIGGDSFSIDDIESKVDEIFASKGITLNIPVESTLAVEDNAQKSASAIVSAMSSAEGAVKDVTSAFQDLVAHISKSGSSPSAFFDKLESGALDVNDELKAILASLGLIDENGKVHLSSLSSGFTNKGGFVSDKYTMIARPDYYLGKIQAIKPKLQNAQKEGAQIGAIFDIIEDKAKGLIYEIQNTVPGKSVLGHHSGQTSQDVLNVSTEHIEGLVHTLQILAKNGLFVDWGGDNVLYDPQKGFSIIDMGDKGGKHFTVSAQNTLQENLDRMVKEMFAFAPDTMKQALQDNFIRNLYTSAQKLDTAIVNPYAPKQTPTAKVAQAASAQTTAAVQKEEDAHEANTAAINAENAAIQAQIELKKKAQAMKWEAFATDDSLAGLKKAAGMKTLGQLAGFWKTANYERQIDFHEITESEAKAIFQAKLPKGLASAWYGSADFTVKDRLENEILADPEIRNAALSYFWHIFKQSSAAKQYPNIKTFEDFLDADLTMYRGDKAPLIYDPTSKLTFSAKHSTAESFDSHIGTAVIKPRHTIGNAGSSFGVSEVETFVPSDQTSWYQKTNATFADYYAQQTKEMQKEIDAGLVAFEKQRVADIIGDKDLLQLVRAAGKDNSFQQMVANRISKGQIPNELDILGDGSNYDKFATAYNGLSDTMKQFVMFYASLDQLSSLLPKQFSAMAQVGNKTAYGKNAVGMDGALFNAILNDPEGRHQHIAALTGEYGFGLMGQTPEDINAEAAAHKKNAQAIGQEAQAQKTLAAAKSTYDDVQYTLWDAAFDANGAQSNDYSSLWSAVYDVQHSDQALVDQGMYKQKSTGNNVSATDLFALVESIEQKYGENLGYVKDYLKQVYANIEFESQASQDSVEPLDFEKIKHQLYDSAKAASKSGDQQQYSKLLGILNDLYDVNAASSEDIANAQYTLSDTGETLDISDLLDMIKRVEDTYGANLEYVRDYLKQIYGEAAIDSAMSQVASSESKPQVVRDKKYSVSDYETEYASQSADAQKAIDDLSLLYQKYQEIKAKTDSEPISMLFPGVPTPDEQKAVLSLFETYKAKQQEIMDLTIQDLDGNKEKIQELMAEVVGLQKQLRGADLGANATEDAYTTTYGLIGLQDGQRLKNLISGDQDIYDIVQILEDQFARKQQKVISALSGNMQTMLATGMADTLNEYLLQNAKKVQAAQTQDTTAADAKVVAAQQQLRAEQDITAEKQKQNALDNQQTGGQIQMAAKTADIQAEETALEALRVKLEQVKAAVALKTGAFEHEAITVNKVVNEEITALEKLKTVLTEIQGLLQLVATSNIPNIGDIQTASNNKNVNTVPGLLTQIHTTLGQILGVLQGSTGVKANTENSVEYKKPVADTNPIASNENKQFDSALFNDLAKEDTLSAIRGAVEQLVHKPSGDESNKQIMDTLVQALLVASTELKNAAAGIIQHQKAAKSDTSVAQARIANKSTYDHIKDVALTSLGDRAIESGVTGMKALADGIVQVTGWLKVAENAWENFTVQVDEAGKVSKLAFSINAQAAKKAAAQVKLPVADEDIDTNEKLYDRAETEARAHAKIEKYTTEGKIATVQFKDSGRYTITILEKIGGLTKQIFQTFDENDDMIERTTATISNNALTKVQELQKFAQYGINNELISDEDQLYQVFAQASKELEAMNVMYSMAGQLTDDQIANWKLQIDLVTQLGTQVKKLVAARQNPVIDGGFSSKHQKQIAAFNADSAKLQEVINIPDTFTQRITDAGNAIRNAVNNQELQIAQNNWAALRKEIELAAIQQDLYVKKSGASGGMKTNAYGATPVVNAKAKFNALSPRAQAYMGDDGLDAVSVAYTKYEASLRRLIYLQAKLQGAEEILPEQRVQFTTLKDECNAYYRELLKIVNALDEFRSNAENPMQIMGDIDTNDPASRLQALKEYVQETYKGKAVIQGFNGDMTELKFALKNTDGTMTNMTATFNAAKTAIGSLRGETKRTSGIFELFGSKVKELGTYMMARLGVDEAIQAIRTGVQYVIEIDSALTELKKVTDETDASYNRFLQTMSQTAGKVGSTVSELTTMAAEWARLGYSMQESAQLAESTAILLNVSEFTDATTASEALISTMQAFGYAADQSQYVVDVLNEVGNNYAISSDGIATALQDSASSLMEAGNTLEQSVALIAAANKVVQDPDSVGSALRTISLRLRGTSVSVLEELGEETDGAVESVSKLQEKVQALSGVNILDASGSYKDTYTILQEIGQVWEDMSDIDQAKCCLCVQKCA